MAGAHEHPGMNKKPEDTECQKEMDCDEPRIQMILDDRTSLDGLERVEEAGNGDELENSSVATADAPGEDDGVQQDQTSNKSGQTVDVFRPGFGQIDLLTTLKVVGGNL